MSEPKSLEDAATGKFCKVLAYYKECFPVKKIGGRVILNKKGNPVRIRVRTGGIVVDDGLRVIRHPLAFHGGAAGTFGEIRERVTHDDLGLPSGIEDGNAGVRRMTAAEMRRHVAGLTSPADADRLMSVCEGI